MLQTMPELELVGLVKSFLAKPKGTATAQEFRAWTEFHSIHDAIIRALLRQIHEDSNVIDDIIQDVWTALFKGLAKLRFDPALGTVTGWIVKIANNMAKKHAREHSKKREESLSSESADEFPDPNPSPDIEFEWMQCEKELRGLIRGFAAKLPEEDERVVVLYWLEERSLSGIAEDMNISKERVWGILRRVSVKLADYLRRKGYRLPRERLSRK